jgi:lipopolysaccharide export system protein LptA
MKHKVVRLALILAFSVSAAAQIYGAQNKPVELEADTIQYDSVKGIMVAQGNVRMVQEKTVMTGNNAEYNNKTQEGHVFGNVRAIKEDATLVAADVRSYNNVHMVATGDPVLTKADNKLVGPQIDYYSDKQYALVTGAGTMTTADGVLTAAKIEAFFNENRAVAEGNVHIVSQTRKMDATSDQAVYYGGKEKQGKTVLTGNARAVQDGNVLTGNTLILYMDKKMIDAQGRSKLVVTPQ